MRKFHLNLENKILFNMLETFLEAELGFSFFSFLYFVVDEIGKNTK
jgi:hypothetical protein